MTLIKNTKRIFLKYAQGIRPGSYIQLSKDHQNYLSSVLRMEEGDKVRVFDGLGGPDWMCDVVITGKSKRNSIVLSALGPVGARSDVQTCNWITDPWLMFTHIRPSSQEFIIEKCTECGTSTFLPVVSDFCTNYKMEKINRALPKTNQKQQDKGKPEEIIIGGTKDEKMYAWAVEAAEQSERCTIPTITATNRLPNVLLSVLLAQSLKYCVESVATVSPETRNATEEDNGVSVFHMIREAMEASFREYEGNEGSRDALPMTNEIIPKLEHERADCLSKAGYQEPLMKIISALVNFGTSSGNKAESLAFPNGISDSKGLIQGISAIFQSTSFRDVWTTFRNQNMVIPLILVGDVNTSEEAFAPADGVETSIMRPRVVGTFHSIHEKLSAVYHYLALNTSVNCNNGYEAHAAQQRHQVVEKSSGKASTLETVKILPILLVGPEGGWSERERHLFDLWEQESQHYFGRNAPKMKDSMLPFPLLFRVALSHTTLRAETASIAGISQINALRLLTNEISTTP